MKAMAQSEASLLERPPQGCHRQADKDGAVRPDRWRALAPVARDGRDNPKSGASAARLPEQPTDSEAVRAELATLTSRPHRLAPSPPAIALENDQRRRPAHRLLRDYPGRCPYPARISCADGPRPALVIASNRKRMAYVSPSSRHQVDRSRRLKRPRLTPAPDDGRLRAAIDAMDFQTPDCKRAGP